MSEHDRFQAVAVAPNALGWQGHTWAASCKDCDWRGPERLHPLDTGCDSIEHTKETGER